jgi:hypothetical protein
VRTTLRSTASAVRLESPHVGEPTPLQRRGFSFCARKDSHAGQEGARMRTRTRNRLIFLGLMEKGPFDDERAERPVDYLPTPEEIAEGCAQVKKSWTRRQERHAWKMSRRPRFQGGGCRRPVGFVDFANFTTGCVLSDHLRLERLATENPTSPTEQGSPVNWGWEYRWRPRRNSRWHGLKLLRQLIEELEHDDAKAGVQHEAVHCR